MFLSRMIKTLVLLVVFYSSSAFAGQSLHLKMGTIDTTTRSAVSQYEQATGPYHIVQFQRTITLKDKQDLSNLGAEVIRYIPDDAYLIKLSLDSLEALKLNRSVQVILSYGSDFKVSPSFGVIDPMTSGLTEKIMIRTFSEQDTEKMKAVASNLGRVTFAKGLNIGLIAPRSAVRELSEYDAVEWIEPYPELKFQNFEIAREFVEAATRKTVNDLDGFESGTKIMNFDAAWSRGFTGRGQIVGFSDTGLDSGNTASIHRDFQGQIKKGYAYGLLSFSWEDPMGHGTHVAGSIAGNGAASAGVLKGGAYEAQLIAGGMWSKLLNNMIPPQDITKMFADAYADGARIHTNSWGSPQNLGAYDQFAQTVDEYMWNNPEMLLMFAAGNSGTDADNDGRVDEDSIGTPATAKNVLSVGASENLVSDGGIQRPIGQLKNQQGQPLFSAEPIASDYLSNNENGIAAFSSRGPTDDKRMKPDVVAPGANILSVHSQVEGANELWGLLNQDYAWSGGTSMSTPLTAGAAAVARQYLVQTVGITNPTAALVKGFLMHTATDLYPGQFGTGGKATGQEMLATRPNPHQGFGRVNMDYATNFDGNVIAGKISQSGIIKLKLNNLPDFKVTMIYTDAPGAASASKALVNNLDIEVYEGGTLIASGKDAINNHEYLEVAGVTGELEIRVVATNLPTTRPDGTVPFALIVSPL